MLVSEHHLQIEATTPLFNLTASDVDSVISELSRFRKKMKPEVPRQLAGGQFEEGVVDPIYAIPLRQGPDEKILFLRHPGLGWVTFIFPLHEAEKLGRALISGSPSPANQRARSREH